MAPTTGKSKKDQVLELLTGLDPMYRGRYAAVARKVGVSRSYVQQVVSRAGGRKTLGLPDYAKMARRLLRSGLTLDEVARATGYSVSHLRELRRQLGIWRCISCNRPREKGKKLCEKCRKERIREYNRRKAERRRARRRSEQSS